MKYYEFLKRCFGKLFGKIIGVPVFWILVFIEKFFVKGLRTYIRNRVYNYCLQNNVYIKRLEERQYELKGDRYIPKVKSHKNFRLKNDGYILYKKVSKIEFLFARTLWYFYDDDSNYDTHDGSEAEETLTKPFGNAFDLGDKRGEFPIVDLKKTFFWIIRNTFYNWVYMYDEIRENDKNNFYIIFPNKGWHFGYIPYENSVRQGRLVYFSEDFDKLDKELIEKYKTKKELC
jgi:hypothetical protein